MSNQELSEYDSRASTPEGRNSLAAAELALKVARLLQLAKSRSGATNKELAAQLNVSEGRVSQILNGDGNLHVGTIGRVLAAYGYELELEASNAENRDQISSRRQSKRPRRQGATSSSPRKTWVAHAFKLTFGDDEGVTEHLAVVKTASDQVPIPLEMPEYAGHIRPHRKILFDPTESHRGWITRTEAAIASEDSAEVSVGTA